MPKGYWKNRERKPLTEEHKRKVGLYFKGKKQSKEMIEKRVSHFRGVLRSEETKKKISLAKTGKKNPKGSGKNHWNWKGGITPVFKAIRESSEYRLWRKAVYERDNYTCIWCGQKGRQLNADHIKPFRLYPELRFAIDNGRTLCESCHKTTDTYGRPKAIIDERLPKKVV